MSMATATVDVTIEIEGEKYSILEIPPHSSSIVLKKRKELLGQRDFKVCSNKQTASYASSCDPHFLRWYQLVWAGGVQIWNSSRQLKTLNKLNLNTGLNTEHSSTKFIVHVSKHTTQVYTNESLRRTYTRSQVVVQTAK